MLRKHILFGAACIVVFMTAVTSCRKESGGRDDALLRRWRNDFLRSGTDDVPPGHGLFERHLAHSARHLWLLLDIQNV